MKYKIRYKANDSVTKDIKKKIIDFFKGEGYSDGPFVIEPPEIIGLATPHVADSDFGKVVEIDWDTMQAMCWQAQWNSKDQAYDLTAPTPFSVRELKFLDQMNLEIDEYAVNYTQQDITDWFGEV